MQLHSLVRRSRRQISGRSDRPVELLEPRRLLSATVTATQLNPPLTTGESWTYQLSGGIVGTETQTVIGPATFNGISATEQDQVNNFTSPRAMTTVKSYLAFTSQGLVNYGTVTTAPGVNTTNTFSPAEVQFPSTLTVGTPFTQSITQTTNSQPSGSTTQTSVGISLTLVSGTPTSVTVPAGTYSAYEVDNHAGGVVIQYWFAPNVGLIKTVINTSSPVTEELSNFSGGSGGGGGGGGGGTGGGGTGTVSGALVASLPSSLVATAPFNLKNAVTLTASGAVSGAVSESILLSPDTSASDSVFTLASGRGTLKLASGKSKTLNLKYARTIPSSAAPGVYNVLVVTTDSAGTVQSTAGQLTVVAATVDLTGSIVTAPSTATAGKKFPLTFTVSNASDANVAAVGTIQIQFDSSADGLLSHGATIATTSRKISLKPGKSLKVNFSVALSGTAFVVVDLDPGNVAFKNDLNPSNNVFATSHAIAVS